MKILRILAAIGLCIGCRAANSGETKPQPSSSATAMPEPQRPSDALDEQDRRRPVPLLPLMAQHQKQNMREHLEAVEEVVAAAGVGDFGKVAAAAKRMGYSEAMGRMCEHMGAFAPGFTEQALAFHHSADEIAAAAAKQDSAAVLVALSQTLRACTSCHRTYKQRLVARLPE